MTTIPKRDFCQVFAGESDNCAGARGSVLVSYQDCEPARPFLPKMLAVYLMCERALLTSRQNFEALVVIGE